MLTGDHTRSGLRRIVQERLSGLPIKVKHGVTGPYVYRKQVKHRRFHFLRTRPVKGDLFLENQLDKGPDSFGKSGLLKVGSYTGLVEDQEYMK
ncbi:hypothetical protein J6590_015390 [Homalodisca vitripennis]|nr:hypothetical protein J6590_015390 [Homalodisca vitripennis]